MNYSEHHKEFSFPFTQGYIKCGHVKKLNLIKG